MCRYVPHCACLLKDEVMMQCALMQDAIFARDASDCHLRPAEGHAAESDVHRRRPFPQELLQPRRRLVSGRSLLRHPAIACDLQMCASIGFGG